MAIQDLWADRYAIRSWRVVEAVVLMRMGMGAGRGEVGVMGRRVGCSREGRSRVRGDVGSR